jgi:hypothetical protein
LRQDTYSCGFERSARGVSVVEEEMCCAASADHPCAAAFNAHSGVSKSFAHFGQRSRPIV